MDFQLNWTKVFLILHAVNACKRDQKSICQHSADHKLYKHNGQEPPVFSDDNLVHVETCLKKNYSVFTHICVNTDHTKQPLFCCCMTYTGYHLSQDKDVHALRKSEGSSHSKETHQNDLQNKKNSLLCCTYHQSSNIFRCDASKDQVAFTTLEAKNFTIICTILLSLLVFVVGLVLLFKIRNYKRLKAYRDKSLREEPLNNQNKSQIKNKKISINTIQNFNNDYKNNKNIERHSNNQPNISKNQHDPPPYSQLQSLSQLPYNLNCESSSINSHSFPDTTSNPQQNSQPTAPPYDSIVFEFPLIY